MARVTQKKTATREAATAVSLQLKVTLVGIEPPIWRRIRVAGDMRLDKLHRVLQDVMGWEESHLYQFEQHGKYYGGIYYEERPAGFRKVIDVRRVSVGELLSKPGDVLNYEYDFGDGWMHEIEAEEVQPHDGASRALCVGGERACPPEDCGGVGGYERLLEAISDPGHEEHEELLEWVGGKLDPEAFDVAKVNRALARLR